MRKNAGLGVVLLPFYFSPFGFLCWRTLFPRNRLFLTSPFSAILLAMKIPVLVDTDTASDDAVALVMALRHPLVDLRAITTVAGNVPVDQAARNALYVTELCHAETPVFVGAAKPLSRPHAPADWFHGKDGLSDRGYAPTRRNAEKTHAVDAIIETVEAHPGI